LVKNVMDSILRQSIQLIHSDVSNNRRDAYD